MALEDLLCCWVVVRLSFDCRYLMLRARDKRTMKRSDEDGFDEALSDDDSGS